MSKSMNNNKYCLITGASGGIGGAIAHKLSSNGYTLILHGRNKEKLVNLQQSLPNESFIGLGDLTQAEDREQILTEAFQIGQIELLVNNAGISCFSSFESMDEHTIEQLININLTAPMLFTQSFIQKLNRSSVNSHVNATIINVGSAFGFIGHPGFSAYCASKFGLRGFTESLARELSDSNIRAAFFAPRATQTEINTADVNELNNTLGNKVDSPTYVAQEFMSLLNSNHQRKVVGWPEKLFARLNGVLPEIVDKAMASKLQKIKQFFEPQAQTLQSSPRKSTRGTSGNFCKARGN
jgi:short-subunit dehydrogenase